MNRKTASAKGRLGRMKLLEDFILADSASRHLVDYMAFSSETFTECDVVAFKI